MKRIFLLACLTLIMVVAHGQNTFTSVLLRNNVDSTSTDFLRKGRLWVNPTANYLRFYNGTAKYSLAYKSDIWNVAHGGTGLTSIAAKSIWVANSSNTITTVTPGAGQSVRINAGNTAWEAYTPSSGVSNSAANNELTKSNGTNIVGTGNYSPSSGVELIGTSTRLFSSSLQTIGAVISFLSFGSASGPQVLLGLNRNASVGSHTIGQDGDVLGEIDFYGDDGASMFSGASIVGKVSGTVSTTTLPTKLEFRTTDTSGPQVRMTITPTGEVSIGPTIPTRKLEVGGSMAIQAGSSSGQIARVGGVIKTGSTTTGNIGTGEDNLESYSVPANSLATDGDALTGTYAGSFATSVNSKRLRLKFGGTTIFDSGALAITTAASWSLEFEIVRTGTLTQKCNVRLTTSSGTLAAYAQYNTAAETLSGAVTLQLTGEATADNDVVKEMFKLKWEPSE